MDFTNQAMIYNDKVYLKDYDIEQNEHFVKYVFIPYFKDIYKDLVERSDKKNKGINHIAFIEVRLYFQPPLACSFSFQTNLTIHL